MNNTLLGQVARNIHRDDDMLKVWTKNGTTYTSWDDWQIRKDGSNWRIFTPSGAPADRWTWQTLIQAKHQAASYGQGAE